MLCGRTAAINRQVNQLWQRLLGRPASESGTLRHGDGTHGRSDRCRRSFVLPILILRHCQGAEQEPTEWTFNSLVNELLSPAQVGESGAQLLNVSRRKEPTLRYVRVARKPLRIRSSCSSPRV